MNEKKSPAGIPAIGGGPRNARLLGSLLEAPVPKRLSEAQVRIILDALAGSRDPALVARFPAVLALCARRGLRVDFQKLLARHWGKSPRRRNLEDLLCVSAALLRRLGVPPPEGLEKMVAALPARTPPPGAGTELQLAGGTKVALSELEEAVRRSATGSPAAEVSPPLPAAPPVTAASLEELAGKLVLLFPQKQIELIMKRLRGGPFTKTEREYFSRVVRKKLAAVADPAVQEAAARLSRGPGGRSPAFEPSRRP